MRRTDDAAVSGYRLRFEALHKGRAFEFPCDARGEVDLDELGETRLRDYLYAHTLIGRDYAMRVVTR